MAGTLRQPAAGRHSPETTASFRPAGKGFQNLGDHLPHLDAFQQSVDSTPGLGSQESVSLSGASIQRQLVCAQVFGNMKHLHEATKANNSSTNHLHLNSDFAQIQYYGWKHKMLSSSLLQRPDPTALRRWHQDSGTGAKTAESPEKLSRGPQSSPLQGQGQDNSISFLSSPVHLSPD